MSPLLLAIACSVALVLLGDLRGHAWQAMALLLGWGFGAWALHRAELSRLRRDLPVRLDVRRLSPWVVLAAAAAVRLPLLWTTPGLSDDAWRYAWEGFSTLHGGNPYAVSPAAWDPAVHGGVDHAVRALVNHPEVSTIYPPVAMWGFAALAAVSPTDPGGMITVFQAAMGLADAGVAAVLAAALRARGRSTDAAWLYAVLPLGAVEATSSAHMEPWGVLCLVLALWAWSRGGSGLGWAGLGALVKLLPGVLLPRLWRRQPWLMALVLAVGVAAAWPFRAAGSDLVRGFSTYAEHWSFNASGFAILSGLWALFDDDPGPARLVAVALGATVSALALWRLRDPARAALWIGGAFVLLSPTVHPWYLLWAWVPALLCGVRSWTLLAVLAPVSYAALASYDAATSTWKEPWWPVWVQYLPFSMALIAEWRWHATRPGPWGPSPAPASSPTSPGPSASPSPT